MRFCFDFITLARSLIRIVKEIQTDEKNFRMISGLAE